MDNKKKQKVLVQYGIKKILSVNDRHMLKFALEKRVAACRRYGFKYVARRYEYIKRVLLGEE